MGERKGKKRGEALPTAESPRQKRRPGKSRGAKKRDRALAAQANLKFVPPDPLDGIDDLLATLVARHQLSDDVAKGLGEYVQLVDWGASNFVPRHAGTPADAWVRDEGDRIRKAGAVLEASLAATDLEVVSSAKRIADIGSGAGFPGIVFAIALPEARVTMIERMADSCAFLRQAIDELGLRNAEVVNESVTSWADGQGAHDVVSSRNVGRMNTILEWSLPLLAPGGAIIRVPSSGDTPKSLAEAAPVAEALGMRLAQTRPVATENHHGQPVELLVHAYVVSGD